MNERIDELFAQAMDKAVPETWTMLTPDQLYRIRDEFAQIMIEECMACATWVGKVNMNPVEPIHTAMAINKRIMKRFDI